VCSNEKPFFAPDNCKWFSMNGRLGLEEVTGDWRKLRNEEFHELCCWPNFILAFRSRSKGFGWQLKERNRLEYLGVNGKIILKWVLKKWNGAVSAVLMWRRAGTRG